MIGITLGTLAAAALVGLVLLGGTPRVRGWSMVCALVLTPLLLLWEVRDTGQVTALMDRPLLALLGAGAGLVLLAGLTALFIWRPALFALVAAVALPFRIPIAVGETAANLLLPLYVVIAAGSLAWAIKRIRGGASSGNGWLERILVGGLVLYALQSIYSIDSSKALVAVVFFYVPFALLFAVVRDIDWTPRLLAGCTGVLVGLAFVFVGIGFWEYETRTLLFNPKIINANQFQEYFRVNSLFFDPNIYGRFLAVVMLALAGVLIWARRWRDVLIAVGVLAVLWAGLVLTLSQSSFSALFVGLVVLAAFRFRAKRVVVVASCVAGLAVAAVLLFPSALRLDLESHSGVNKASSGRLDLVKGGMRLAAAKPLTGYGAGSFSRAYREHERNSDTRAVSASHTIPITVAAEQGVAGLALYVALIVAAFSRLFRREPRRRGQPRPITARTTARAVVAAAFVGLVLHTLIYAAFLEDPLAWALLAIGVALAPSTITPIQQDEDLIEEAFAVGPETERTPA